MNNLIHTINKFNGNICFAGSTDSGDYVFECDRDNRALSYATSTRLITGVCPETSTSYLVAFSNPMIGQYSNVGLTENYINSGMTDVRKITGNSAYGYFFFNSLTNELVKYDGGIIWTYSLPDFALRYQGDIIFRESDRMVLYYNNSNVHFIRDDLTSATLMNTLAIDGDGDMIVGLGSQWNPAYCYARYRQVTGTILDQSSSSSSSLCDCPDCFIDGSYSCTVVAEMTSNTDPSPFVATASSEYGGSQAYQCFDRYSDDLQFSLGSKWVSIDLGSAKTIDHYAVTSVNLAPTSWVLQGSNSVPTWTTIHTVSSVEFNFFTLDTKCFTYIGNVTAYRYYRLFNIGGPDYLRIYEWQLAEGV